MPGREFSSTGTGPIPCPRNDYWTWQFNQPECDEVRQGDPTNNDGIYTQFALGTDARIDPGTLSVEVDQRKVSGFSVDSSSGVLTLPPDEAGQCRSVILVRDCVN